MFLMNKYISKWQRIIGLVLSAKGLLIIFFREHKGFGYINTYEDYGEYHYIVGFIFLFAGLVLIRMSMSKKM